MTLGLSSLQVIHLYRSLGKKRVLVYDLGGGTFDVSVVDIEHHVVEVLSSHGNNHLGGDDFDGKIVSYIVDHLLAEHKLDEIHSSKAKARITRAAEQAKILLSDQPFVLIEESALFESKGQPVHLSLELSRDD
jgi:molecular chaperone DnaK